MSVFDSVYERLQLADKIAHLFDLEGVRVDDLEEICGFVKKMVENHDKVTKVAESKAVEALCEWYRNEADMDDIAREYSRILGVGPVQVKGEQAADSDVFENGERIEFEEQNESEEQ